MLETANTTNTTAIMLFGLGNHDDDSVKEFNKLAGNIRERLPQYDVESGLLEFATPDIRAGLEKLIARGAKKIICVPGMLLTAGHLKKDLPPEINNFASFYPNIEFVCAHELAINPKLLTAAKGRIEECETNALNSSIDRKETLLMVAGHGTKDAGANSNVHKVARMLWEGMGFGWAEVSYSGVAYPLVDEGVTHAMKLGYKRIIVFPYFLFTGVLVRRIYAWADEAAAAHPDIEVLNASYLNDHTQLLDCFVDRIEEALVGSNAMNCLLCKYREQVIDCEGDVARAQVGHHHHVSSIDTDGHGAHDHDHGHSHDNSPKD